MNSMTRTAIGTRRSAVEIILDIFSACRNKGANKIAIMYGSNLSYAQLQRYLSLLCAQELLAKNGGCYAITVKGRELMEQLVEVELAEILYNLKGGENCFDGKVVYGSFDVSVPRARQKSREKIGAESFARDSSPRIRR